jgi:hypothetical protein
MALNWPCRGFQSKSFIGRFQRYPPGDGLNFVPQVFVEGSWFQGLGGRIEVVLGNGGLLDRLFGFRPCRGGSVGAYPLAGR